MANLLTALTSSATSALQSLPSPEHIPEQERLKLVTALNKLLRAIEPPPISLQHLTQSDHGLVATRIAMGMGVFDAFAKSSGEMNLNELDMQTQGDKMLLLRIMHILSTNGIFNVVEIHKWKTTTLASMLVTDSPPYYMVIHFYEHMKSHANLYQYFESNGFKNPEDAYNSPWQFALNTPKHYLDWIEDDKLQSTAFDKLMTIHQQLRGQDWFEFFPVQEKFQSSTANTTFIDIGGGLGHDISKFRARYPSLHGRFILQELPRVVDSITTPLPSGIEIVKYDMFTPQPEPCAKAYYMRTVMHDWPDKQALTALKRIREAMAPDSLFLLNENLMPEVDPPFMAAASDFIMMNCFSALERTEKQWLDLLGQAGFKVLQVWKPPHEAAESTALFEAVAA